MPEFPNQKVVKGYLTLPSDWLKHNPKFILHIPFRPRFISPHPFTNQDIVALARGPLVYCVEDADNPWENDHFKYLSLNPAAKVTETQNKYLKNLGEECISLTVHDGVFKLAVGLSGPDVPRSGIVYQPEPKARELNFIPYCLRDNRGGKGQMRVGLRTKR